MLTKQVLHSSERWRFYNNQTGSILSPLFFALEAEMKRRPIWVFEKGLKIERMHWSLGMVIWSWSNDSSQCMTGSNGLIPTLTKRSKRCLLILTLLHWRRKIKARRQTIRMHDKVQWCHSTCRSDGQVWIILVEKVICCDILKFNNTDTDTNMSWHVFF